VAQKLLSEMITFLGIMSANIYNGLYTRQYVVEMLVGSAGTYRVYKSYETEFNLKASATAKQGYARLKTAGPLGNTNNYLDTVFKKFRLDSTYTPHAWQAVSISALQQLTTLQKTTLARVEAGVAGVYRKEIAARNRTLVFLVFSILFVSAIVYFITRSITTALRELKVAAKAIARGAPSTPITVKSRDIIANLAASIKSIEKNNKELASAANSIGKGKFDVPVVPRSSEDVLGNAIVEMKASLQKYTSELTASNAELERFAYVASHDLQEPLRMVSSFLHLLEKKMGPQLDETNKQYMDFAVDGAERMKSLIQDLLQYSRVGTNKDALDNVDCNEVVASVSTVLSVAIKESGATIQSANKLPVVRAVPAQMLQLFQNLIGNAIKYRRVAAPSVEIGSTDKGKFWEFYVKDNGIGIESRFFEKIFIIFQRLHNKTEYSGTGIGLSICRKIVEKHGGIIRVESEPGNGSIFYFTLPKHQI
jgi:signal transduction histidine kinase